MTAKLSALATIQIALIFLSPVLLMPLFLEMIPLPEGQGIVRRAWKAGRS